MTACTRILALLLVTALLPGCHFSAGIGKASVKQESATQTVPNSEPIPGTWSKPVNGVRMMARPIASTGYNGGNRTVLIFAENISDQAVNLPGFSPVPFAMPRSQRDSAKVEFSSSENLRIEFERTDGQLMAHDLFPEQMSEELRELTPELLPGEIRLFALVLKTDQLPLQMMDQLRDQQVPSDMVQWMIHDHQPTAYRLILTYRPDGFGPEGVVDPQASPRFKTWKDKQIDLPPIELIVSPSRINER